MKKEKISLISAIILNINIMVGSAIFAFPSLMTGIAGNASFISWGIMALLFLPLVICVAQLSKLFPGSGGFYTYTKMGLGKEAGYLSGWLYVVGYTFAVVLEGLALRHVLLSRCLHINLIDNAIVFNFLFISALVLFNMLSLKALSRSLSLFTICKIVPLVILILFIPFIINPGFTISGSEISALPFALPWAIFGYFGFEYCCSISQHIENSEKNGSRAIIIGFIVTALIYMLFHFGLLNLMGAQKLTECGASAYASFLSVPIPYLKEFINFLIPLASILAIYATAAGLLNATTEILYAMVGENLFYKSQALSLTNRYGRPYILLLVQGLAVFIILNLIPNIDIVTGLCNVGVFLFYLLPFISLLVLQRKMVAQRKTSLTILAIFIIVGLILYNWLLMGNTITERLLYTALLCSVIGAGFLIKDRK